MNTLIRFLRWLRQQHALTWVCILLLVTPFTLAACDDEPGKDDPEYQYKQAVQLLSAFAANRIADGQVYASGVGTNLWAINRALTQAPNAVVFMNEAKTQVIFAAPTAFDKVSYTWNWWFAMVDIRKFQLTSSAIQNFPELGNVANGKSFATIVKTAEEHGWKVVAPDKLPWTFRLSLISAMHFLATSVSANLTDFLAVPLLDNGDGWQEPIIELMPPPAD